MNEPPEITNPFPGLRPFETDEYRLFFGREGQSDELVSRLGRARFLAVVGTSGSGKSSLVRAGLLPALRGGMMAGAGAGWRIAVMRPGGDPVGNLARVLASRGVLEEAGGGLPPAEAEAVIEATLRGGSLGLVEAVRQARLAGQDKLLVIADQFEELFRFRAARAPSSTDDAAAFVKLLIEAARQRELNIYVVLTMRSDFLGDCSQFQGLPEAINDGQYLIPRMTRDERRAAIVGPVRVARGRMSEPLVNRLLNEVGDNPDQLPILQHALMRTWDYWSTHRGDGEPLGLGHYEAIGTMAGALSEHADEAYNELPEGRGRHIAELLFKALTERGADNREIRRPTRLSEVCKIAGASAEEVAAVVEVFRREGRSFLMPPVGFVLTPDTVLDISHESLIRNWERLKKWVDEEAQSARTYKRLADAAALNRKGEEGLMQDPGLQLALDWRGKSNPNAAWGRRYHPEFDTAIAYLDESRAAQEAARAEVERRKQEELERERQEIEQTRAFAEQQARAARRLRWAAVAMAVLFVLSLGTAAYAYRLKQFAQESYESAVKATDEAVKARESAEKEKEKAVLLFRQLQENNKQLDEEKEVSAARAEQAEEEKKKAVAAQDKAEAAEDAALGAKKVAEEASAEALASKKTAVENLEKARAANDRGDLTIQGFEMSVRDFPNRAMDSFDKLAGQIDNTLKRASGSMSESEVRELKLSLGWALSHLGAEQLKTGDLSGAKASYERSRDIFEAEYPRESQVNKYPTPFLFDMYHGLGRAYHNIALEGGDEAKKYYEQAKGVFLSSLEVQMTQFEGAELAAKATKDTNESAETAFFVNEGAKQVTASRLALAHLYRDMGQPDDAEKVLVELVNFQTARGDADKLIAARNELAEFNRDQNLFLAAERDYKKLIEEQEKHVGDIEADYAQRGVGLAASYNELAEVYRAQGAEKRQKSEDAYAAAIAIQRLATRLRRLQAAGDSNDVDIREDSTDDPADNAGDAYVKLGKFERARSLYEYALGVREAGSGPIRRDLWKSYDKLTRLYREKGFADDAKAEEYNLKLISELSNVEPNSPRHAEALSLCADIYAKQERPSEARAYYENALGIYAERNDWMNQNVVLYRIGELYKLKKAVRPEWKAASLRRLELLTTQLNKIVGTKETLPRGSITLVTEYLDAVETVAVIQTLDKNDVEAAATYQKAFDTYDFIKGRIYNPRALSIYAKFLNRYKVLLNKLGRQEEAAKVEASISGLQAKANDINQEQQGSQPTPQGQTQPAGAQ